MIHVKAHCGSRLDHHRMEDSLTLILGTVALLATPGPTNTLLATSGAARGLRNSVPLLAGELLGYLLAIAILRTLIGPVLAVTPVFAMALSAIVAVYLLYLAWTLWRHSDFQLTEARPITVQRVFLTTVLNPKAVIFAFVLLPSGPVAGWSVWWGLLSVAIVTIGVCWIAAGTLLHARLDRLGVARLSYRAGAFVLVLVAGIISGRGFGIT